MPIPAPFISVAIDGGAASGKSSTARALSRKFNLMHVDTGSHYRAITRVLLDHEISFHLEEEIASFLATLPLKTSLVGREAHLRIPGYPLSRDDLRSPDVNRLVSHYSAVGAVRAALKDYQRSLVDYAREHGLTGLVMEGRDIGSVILPSADFRFYLDADPSMRAKRRKQEGQSDSISERDRLDRSRKVAPLGVPRGAIVIDTTHLTLEEVVDQVSEFIQLEQQAS